MYFQKDCTCEYEQSYLSLSCMHGSGKVVKPRNGMDYDLKNLFGKVCFIKKFFYAILRFTLLLLLEDKQQFKFWVVFDIFSIVFSHFSSDLIQIRGVLDKCIWFKGNFIMFSYRVM